MEEKKVSQQINDFVGDNVRKLAQLFPSAVKDGEVDFEALKEELGQFQEVESEKYELTWAGKQNAKKIAQEDVVGKTLKFIPEDSKNADTTENLYIEGDNLEVLKLLRQNYYGAIKMIYIDPPYNTGNDFIYNDDFSMREDEYAEESGEINDVGLRYTKNINSSGRFHSTWCSMIYTRLIIAKDLLCDEGFVFISIDDHEYDNLKKICDEIFGVDSFFANIAWRRQDGQTNIGSIARVKEYILIYSKSTNRSSFGRLPLSEKAKKDYQYQDENGFYGRGRLREPVRGRYNYDVISPDGFVCKGPWLMPESDFNKLREQNLVHWPEKEGGSPRKKIYLKDMLDKGQIANDFWGIEFGTNQRASNEIDELFKKRYFDFPKPTSLITTLTRLGTTSEDIVLDFFSGSATTAHAVMQLNAEDGGNRKFIMVQLPELCDEKSEAYKAGYKNICEIGKERIRRAGDKIMQEHPEADIDTGFKVFRTADTNIKWNSLMDVGQVRMEQLVFKPELLDFMPDTNDVDVVYELMLRQRDVALSESLEFLSDIGNRTYLYASSYLVCLETEITEELVDKLAALDPLPIKFIFRDSAFKDDIALKDETFRRLRALIEKNSGISKKTYTVEFI